MGVVEDEEVNLPRIGLVSYLVFNIYVRKERLFGSESVNVWITSHFFLELLRSIYTHISVNCFVLIL